MQLTRHVKGTKQIDRVTGVYVANSTKQIDRKGTTRHVKGTKQIDRVTGVYVANSTRKGDQTN